MSNNPKTIAALARADCKGGVCIGSVDDYQFVVRQVVPDRMGKRYGLSACNGYCESKGQVFDSNLLFVSYYQLGIQLLT